jgi:site-specific DNA-methyltransferase (adenine-specific)
MNIKSVDIAQVKTNPNNPRIIKDDKYAKLVESIRTFPKMLEIRPIVVNADMIVLGGNMRLRACKEAGLKKIPVIMADDLTPEQQREFIIKDNVGFGEWDWEMIANEWEAEELEKWGLDVPEYNTEEAEAQEDDYEIPDEITTDIVLGDLFEIGQHRLLCGDSTNTDTWEKVMNGCLANMVMTDPPYNVAYVGKTKDALTIQNDKQSDLDFDQFLYDFYTALGAYTKAGGSWYVWSPPGITETQFRNQFIASGLLLKQCLVWVKNSMVMGRQDYQWKHESCLYGWKEGAAHYFVDDRTKTTVIEDNVNIAKLTKEQMKKMLTEILSEKTPTSVLRADKPHKSIEHPTMKPILLIAPLIQNSSKEGWIVSDGFLGSGSTMVASHQLNRKCYGMELDPKYCQVIVDRMLKLDPTLEVKLNGIPYIKTVE